MNTMRDEIADGFLRVVTDACPPDRVHAIEAGGDAASLWAAFEASGFLDALVPEADGGIGLSLSDAAPILTLAGSHVAPVPLAETLMLRGLLAASAVSRPNGAIAFGGVAAVAGGHIVCRGVIEGGNATTVLACVRGTWRLLATNAATVSGALEATLHWPASAGDEATQVTPAFDPLLAEALVRAHQLAGACAAVLDRTLGYANDRVQFGRPIGKFQAIQHQLSVMAEHVFAARMAVEMATVIDSPAPDPLRTAIAKARAGEAAAEVAALTHSIHGAIGFTREYDLHLYTRRLHAWRRAAGGDAVWQRRVGAALIAHPGRYTLDLLREATAIA